MNEFVSDARASHGNLCRAQRVCEKGRMWGSFAGYCGALSTSFSKLENIVLGSVQKIKQTLAAHTVNAYLVFLVSSKSS